MIPLLNALSLKQLKNLFATDKLVVQESYDYTEQTWFSEIAFKIASYGKPGIDFLITQTSSADEAHLYAIISAFALAKIKIEPLHILVRSFINDERPLIIAAAIDTASRLDYKDLRDNIVSLQGHDSPYVVGSSLRFLSKHYPDIAIPLLLQALASHDSIIVQNGIDELDNLDYVQALPQIQSLQKHEDANVREAAQGAAKRLVRKIKNS